MPTEDEKKQREKKLYKRVAMIGVAIGILCHFLPPEYQAVCKAIANVCTTGGI